MPTDRFAWRAPCVALGLAALVCAACGDDGHRARPGAPDERAETSATAQAHDSTPTSAPRWQRLNVGPKLMQRMTMRTDAHGNVTSSCAGEHASAEPSQP